jgi:hypothetical protein
LPLRRAVLDRVVSPDMSAAECKPGIPGTRPVTAARGSAEYHTETPQTRQS